MGSPFYGALLEYAAASLPDDPELHALFGRNAHRSRVALRLAGAAHYRALRGEAPAIAAHYPSTGGDGDAQAAWAAIRDDVHAHEAVYEALIARPVQTNEVARSLPVLASMLTVANATRMPLRLFEIGSSAGLILNFDLYRYAGDDWAWGDPDSPLKLENSAAAGGPEHLDADLDVLERHGCDLHPLDARNPVDAGTLLGFVWPDQTARFARLRTALEIAAAHPPLVETADGIEWLGRAVRPAPGTATVVMHTVITEHMTQDVRERLRAQIRRIGEEASVEAPFAWARMEPGAGAYETAVTIWPAREETFIARSDGHAQNLEWSVRAH